MIEKWRDIPGFEGCYMVSTCYRVASIERVVMRSSGRPYRIRSRELRPKTHYPSGLQSVTLARDGQQHTRYVHRLVADVFGHSVIQCSWEVQQMAGGSGWDTKQTGIQRNTSPGRKAS